jgi:NitT/TauT family transport system ATP-binding protein
MPMAAPADPLRRPESGPAAGAIAAQRSDAWLCGRGLARRHGALTIFESIDLDVGAGEFLTLIGASGCGKSTLLRMLAGLDAPSAGAVHLGKQRIERPPPEVVYLFQQYEKSIFPWLDVQSNVAFGLRRRADRPDAAGIRSRVAEVIRRVGLGGFENYYPRQLSGGMQQRVALARALACQPQVLLLDEPFSAVDALTRANLQMLLLELWRELGLTIVFVTHDVDEAVFLSGRVIALTGRPARMEAAVVIDLPHPRDPVASRADGRFAQYRNRLYLSITRPARPGAPAP